MQLYIVKNNTIDISYAQPDHLMWLSISRADRRTTTAVRPGYDYYFDFFTEEEPPGRWRDLLPVKSGIDYLTTTTFTVLW